MTVTNSADSLDNSESQARPAWFHRAVSALPTFGHAIVAGASIEWCAWGEIGKPGLLLLPGSGAHFGWWKFLGPFFSTEFRVATLSWSGMGGSEWRQRYSMALYAEEIFSVIEASGMMPSPAAPVIVGHSFGGVPTLMAAKLRGEALRGAIVVDSRLRLGQKWSAARLMPRRHKVHVDKQQAIESFYLVPRQATRNRYIIEHLADEAVGQPPEGVGWALRFDPNLRAKTEFGDLANLIGDAKCSLAFVRGSDSLVVDDETWADHRVQAPPMTPFIEIPEAGHHVMVDQPLALVATLRALLANMHLDQTIKQLR